MRRKDDVDLDQDGLANSSGSPDDRSLPLLGRLEKMLPLPSHIVLPHLLCGGFPLT